MQAILTGAPSRIEDDRGNLYPVVEAAFERPRSKIGMQRDRIGHKHNGPWPLAVDARATVEGI
jgi:hypothetical protein